MKMARRAALGLSVMAAVALAVTVVAAERALNAGDQGVSPAGRVDFELLHVYHHDASPTAPKAGRLDVDAKKHPARPMYHSLLHRPRHARDPRDTTTISAPILPDPTDQTTVLRLAEMSFDAYEVPGSPDWRAVGGYDDQPDPIGVNDTGLRGHVFGTADRSVLVMAIKGTSLDLFNMGGPTAEQDRLIDNLMFSCCCARVNVRWTPVCGCYNGGPLARTTCDQSCVVETMQDPSTLNYFTYAKSLYTDLRTLYPEATVWFTGHSLGGSLASLLALDAGATAFCYEAPGERLYAERLGFAIDRDNMGKYPIYHFGNTADPIFTGTCTGVASTCYLTGYAMESKCHIGSTCVYKNPDIPSVNEHRLAHVIDTLIIPKPVPQCVPEDNCVDCGDWTFM